MATTLLCLRVRAVGFHSLIIKNGSVDRGLHARFQHGTHEVRTLINNFFSINYTYAKPMIGGSLRSSNHTFLRVSVFFTAAVWCVPALCGYRWFILKKPLSLKIHRIPSSVYRPCSEETRFPFRLPVPRHLSRLSLLTRSVCLRLSLCLSGVGRGRTRHAPPHGGRRRRVARATVL